MRPSLLALIVLAIPSLVISEETKPRTERWSLDDYAGVEGAYEPQISPDGKSLLWTKTTANDEAGTNVSSLMLTGLDDEFEIQLTRGSVSASSARWSPDGKKIAFLSSRPDPDAGSKRARSAGDEESLEQIWILDMRGGEPFALTSGTRDVSAFEWRSNDSILYIAQEEASIYEQEIEESEDTSTIVEDARNEPPVRVFEVFTEDSSVLRITKNTDWIDTISVSPDGKQMVTVHQKSLSYGWDSKTPPEVFITEIESGKQTKIFEDRRYEISKILWEPNSSAFFAAGLYGSSPTTTEATITRLYRYEVASNTLEDVDLKWGNGLSNDPGYYAPTYTVVPDGFVALLANGAVNRAARYKRSGKTWRQEFLSGDNIGRMFDVVGSPTSKSLVYLVSAPDMPEQWHVAKIDDYKLKSPRQLTTLNPQFDTKRLAKAEIITWMGARDHSIEGILHYPHDYEPGKTYPLIVNIHGGPFGADYYCWNPSWYDVTNYYCQEGAFVLSPNYHGSSNYGLEFAESISNGKYYEYPVEDIEKGIDDLIAKGLVDGDRIGLKGWSNGAILTLALIAKSPRYKAAASGAGGAEWIADWANCAFGDSFGRYYFGGNPLDNPEIYRKLAPIFDFKNVTTPTIIFHGDIDTAVPTLHGWMQFRALQFYAKTDVRFVLFPGEEHSIRQNAHKKRKVEEEAAWFAKYLFGKPEPIGETPVARPGTQLERLVHVASASNDGTRYGVMSSGILAPEMVEYSGYTISKFEITRAQFAEFRPDSSLRTDESNLPATDVTFETAQAYAKWLSEKLGEKCSLVDAGTADAIYGDPDASQNTLDYWAGYSLNPEEAARALAAIGGKSLLLPVGSFPGDADPHRKSSVVFDLNGNAAEWTLDEEGKGVLRGGSADLPIDAMVKNRQAAPAYRGFRVMKAGGQ